MPIDASSCAPKQQTDIETQKSPDLRLRALPLLANIHPAFRAMAAQQRQSVRP